jgi:hypothetical protein
MAAAAALPAETAIRISAPSTLARKRKPSEAKRPARTVCYETDDRIKEKAMLRVP